MPILAAIALRHFFNFVTNPPLIVNVNIAGWNWQSRSTTRAGRIEYCTARV